MEPKLMILLAGLVIGLIQVAVYACLCMSDADDEKQTIPRAQEDSVDPSQVKLEADMLREAMEEEQW